MRLEGGEGPCWGGWSALVCLGGEQEERSHWAAGWSLVWLLQLQELLSLISAMLCCCSCALEELEFHIIHQGGS